ncbi:heparin lyase I family protein [Celerinatantimonas sp. YJH-8]|uniref:heparin lyase I family protein n=1 Tax=Celerinatantimonas sp. YJH-8 TaxID=3228714 RepID=UPI0038CBD19B
MPLRVSVVSILLFHVLISFSNGAVSSELNDIDRGLLNPMMRSLNDAPWGYQARTMTDHEAIELFTVKHGDCFANRNWDDCKQDRQRSELSEKHKSTHSGEHLWYHWEFFIDNHFPDIYPTKVTLVQFHQVRAKPSWMFELDHQGYWLVNHLHRKDKQRYLLLPWATLRGNWHQFDVEVQWSKKTNGSLRVWVDEKPFVNYQGPTMSADISYFKYGLYQAFISRYQKTTGLNTIPEQQIYYRHVWAGKQRWQGQAASKRPPEEYFKP